MRTTTFMLFCVLSNGILRGQAVVTSSSPGSDPTNSAGWILNETVSDEFSDAKLNEEKWLIQGKDGVYKSNWVGRAPSQFSTENVRIENGMLKLQSRWEPEFKFAEKLDMSSLGDDGKGRAYENITTAAVICKNQFHYGYLEIKCKAANASVTSSFWGTGGQSELDVFEFIGAPSLPHKAKLSKQFQSNVIDWGKNADPKNRQKWRGKVMLDWNVADDFHVYGCDWTADSLKFYADGQLIQTVTKQELGDGWVMTQPLWIWVDSETFPWDGLPTKETLPADFEIEYIRVWQTEAQRTAEAAALANPSNRPKSIGDSTLDEFLAIEKAKSEKNGWKWNPSKAKQLFKKMDADKDGIASGVEKKAYWAK